MLKTNAVCVLYCFMLAIVELTLVYYCAYETKELLKSSKKNYSNVPQLICSRKY